MTPADRDSVKTAGLVALIAPIPLLPPSVMGAQALIRPDSPTAVEAENLALVGHSPVENRGLNRARTAG